MVNNQRRPVNQRRVVNSRRTELFAGFWFLTVCVALTGPVLMIVVLAIDKTAGPAGVLESLVISPTSAQTIPGAIAGSLITIASLTASLTIVTLQLLSNQYTPRAVRGFLRRKISQVVSGAFIGIFVYSLLMLVTVRAPGDENDPFVPSLGVVMAIGLSLLGLVLLVVFIDRLAKTIQVATMTAELARDTVRAIDLVHPDPYVAVAQSPSIGDPSGDSAPLFPRRAGYVTRTTLDLPFPASLSGSRLELLVRPGDFVTTRTPIARWSSATPLDGGLRKVILSSVFVGDERDIDQDPAFGIRQLVDITLRAISPGTNDPTTAVTCIGYLRDVFECLTVRDLPGTIIASESGVTLVAHQDSLEAYLEPLTEIARYATKDARVTITLLDALAGAARTSVQVGAMARHRELADLAHDLAQPALAAAETSHDRSRLEAVLARVEAGA